MITIYNELTYYRMELKYIVLTIIKILISVPSNFYVNAAALMGGYMDNSNRTGDFLDISIGSDGVHQRQNTSVSTFC